MYTTLENLENYLPAQNIKELLSKLDLPRRQQISLNDVLKSNGIVDAQISFPAFIGHEKLGLLYLVSCLKHIQPLLKNQKFNMIFESIENITAVKIEADKEYELLQNLLKVIKPIVHNHSEIYKKLNNILFNQTENVSEIYRSVAIAEAEQAIYCLLRWAVYSNPQYKTKERMTMEVRLYQNSFSNALQAALNGLAYQKSSEMIQNNEIYQNVMNCCLNKQEKLFEEIILSQYDEATD